MNRTLLSVLVGAGALWAVAPHAAAQSVSYSVTVSSGIGQILSTAQLPQFDLPGEKLKSVDFSVVGSYIVHGKLINNASKPEMFQYTTQSDFTVTLPGATAAPIATLHPDPTYSLTLTSPLKAGGVLAYSSGTQPITSTADTGAIHSGLSVFQGNGDFSFDYKTVTGFSLTGGGGNIHVNQVASSGLVAKVTYIYASVTSVPEFSPSISLGILLVGGLAARCLRRMKPQMRG